MTSPPVTVLVMDISRVLLGGVTACSLPGWHFVLLPSSTEIKEGGVIVLGLTRTRHEWANYKRTKLWWKTLQSPEFSSLKITGHSVTQCTQFPLLNWHKIQETWSPGGRRGSVPGKGVTLVMSYNNNWNTFISLLNSALLPQTRRSRAGRLSLLQCIRLCNVCSKQNSFLWELV